ncbi:uncharacterized protein EI97DRAFT_441489 [Westerdykella ornata]|uniref:Uncharacterized protein n=1 Tax=Westerdykella ornata TaxID=318751 RepID=A0A6A6JNE2_WESOR|nr:uncharacterized protein EI97DRAFT_441489 [Westerdykella ornata]KAF2277438.1 hypothetical protein EI97DRAFT_441489 [Westerdykella ornata]
MGHHSSTSLFSLASDRTPRARYTPLFQDGFFPSRRTLSEAVLASTGNNSTPSLRGMEHPVRSFKSFVKTVPPAPNNVAHHKPLPPTPAGPSRAASLTSQTSPASPASAPTPSISPWRAPTEWSTTAQSVESNPTPPANRRYSPLLPDPSPDQPDGLLELCAAQGESPQLQEARLVPIYERTDLNLGSPKEPPKSLLPPPPRSPARASPERKVTALPLSNNSAVDSGTQRSSSPASGVFHIDSPADSTRSKTSNMSTREKEFVRLELDRSRDRRMVQASGQNYNTEKTMTTGFGDNRSPASHGSSRQPRCSGRANYDACYDLDLSEYARRLAVSRDYHDMLVDEYHDTQRAQEGHPRSEYAAPLSWNRDSNGNSSRSTSETRPEFESSATSSRRTSSGNLRRLSNKVTSWVPRRLSVAPKRSQASDECGHWEDFDTDDHLGFSRFFPKSNRSHFGRKSGRKSSKEKVDGSLHGRSASALDTPQSTGERTPTPILRLPLGISVVRTPPAPPSPTPSPPPGSHITALPNIRGHRSTVSSNTPASTMSTAPRAHSPISAEPPSHRSSYNNYFTAADVANRAIQRTARSSNRDSGGEWSARSQHSPLKVGQSPPRPRSRSPPQTSRRIPTRIPNYPPPISASNCDSKEAGTGTVMKRASTERWPHPPAQSLRESQHPREHVGSIRRTQLRLSSFPIVERLREGRRGNEEEARHERLKRSIRVLGPTDPTVVAVANVGGMRRKGSPDVGRLPGFMVGGVV